MSPTNLLNFPLGLSPQGLSSLGPFMQVQMLKLHVEPSLDRAYIHVLLELNRSARCAMLLAAIEEAINDVYLQHSNGVRVYADVINAHPATPHASMPSSEFVLRFELDNNTAQLAAASEPIEIGCSHGEYRFSTTLATINSIEPPPIKRPVLRRNSYWLIDRATDIFRDKLAWIFVIAYVSSIWLLLPVQAA